MKHLSGKEAAVTRPQKILLAVAIAAAILFIAFSETLAGRLWPL